MAVYFANTVCWHFVLLQAIPKKNLKCNQKASNDDSTPLILNKCLQICLVISSLFRNGYKYSYTWNVTTPGTYNS